MKIHYIHNFGTNRDGENTDVIHAFQGSKMTLLVLWFLLVAPVMLVASRPAQDSINGTVPLVMWHGMGEYSTQIVLSTKKN